jgi:DNA-binding NarL/FixJ family response regulator
MEVVGEAQDGETALALVEKLMPDIIVMDVAMPNVNGIEATRKIVNKFPKVKVVALSIHSDEGFVYNMIKAGASGYVLKVSIFDELLKAMQAVSAGHAYLSPEITRIVINIIKKGKIRESLIDTLTEREHKVVESKWKGKNTKQIALELHVSPKTIEADSHKIFTKLHVQSWPEVFRLALQENIISP